MPTADEKPVYIRIRPFTYCKLEPTCQDGNGSSASSDVGGFLLLNFEPSDRDSFALSLRLRGHRIIVPEEHGKTYADLTDDEILGVDYLFCDLTHRINHDRFQALRRICRLRRHGISLPKTCWVPQEWTHEFQRFVGAQFEAHIVPCKTQDLSLLPETILNTSGNEKSHHETATGGTL